MADSMKNDEAFDAKRFVETKPKLWTANYLLVWSSTLILFLAFTSMTPTLPLYMERYGNIAGAAGFPLAALTIGAVLSRPFAGWGLDLYGRKRIFWGGMMLFILPSIIYIGMVEATLLIALRFIQGIGWGFCNTAVNTVASDNIPIKRMGEGMGYFTLTSSIAMLAGPAIGLWLVDNYSFSLYFTAALLILFISVIPMLFVKYQRAEKNIQKQKQKLKPVFMDKDGLKPAFVTLLYCLGNSAAFSFLPVYAMTQGVTNSWVFFTSFPISSIIFRPLFGALLDKKGKKGCDLVVVIGIIAQILAMLVLARTSSTFHLILGGSFFGIGFGALQLAMFADTIRRMPVHKRGAANATFWTAFDLGIAAGSILWGLLAALWGFFMMFHLTIIFTAAALLVYFFMPSRPLPQGNLRDPL